MLGLDRSIDHEHPLVMVKSIELLELSKKDRNLILGENISRLIGS